MRKKLRRLITSKEVLAAQRQYPGLPIALAVDKYRKEMKAPNATRWQGQGEGWLRKEKAQATQGRGGKEMRCNMERKQQRHLRELGVEPLYYYEGRTTVCLLKEGGAILARGVAVCSPSDQFVKRVGRAKALGMALRACIRMLSTEVIYPGSFPKDHPLWGALKFRYMSSYAPELTEREQAILAANSRLDAGWCPKCGYFCYNHHEILPDKEAIDGVVAERMGCLEPDGVESLRDDPGGKFIE